MFNFSANHLFLLQRTEYPVLLVLDCDTRSVYRLHDFTKALHLRPGLPYCISGKVNSAGKLDLVIESLKPDTKHAPSSTIPDPWTANRTVATLQPIHAWMPAQCPSPSFTRVGETADVSADAQTGARCGRLSGVSAVILDRR
jgi:hypothetical protein